MHHGQKGIFGLCVILLRGFDSQTSPPRLVVQSHRGAENKTFLSSLHNIYLLLIQFVIFSIIRKRFIKATHSLRGSDMQ